MLLSILQKVHIGPKCLKSLLLNPTPTPPSIIFLILLIIIICVIISCRRWATRKPPEILRNLIQPQSATPPSSRQHLLRLTLRMPLGLRKEATAGSCPTRHGHTPTTVLFRRVTLHDLDQSFFL